MLIAIDIGGTKTRIGRADDADALAAVDIFHTFYTYREGLDALVDAVKRIAGGKPRGAAVGAPGVISRHKRRIVNAPNLPDWNGAALADELERRWARP